MNPKITTQKMLSICLITALAMTIAISTTSSTQAQLTSTNVNTISDNHVDISSLPDWLSQKGYSLQDVNLVSGTETIKLLHSMSNQDVNMSMAEIRQNLFGNSTGPIPIPSKTAEKAIDQQKNLESTEIGEGLILDSPTSGQGCLIVTIWDYAPAGESTGDLSYIHGAYTGISYNVNNADYDYVATLTNADATYENIWQWLTWLCASYADVDVYMAGHGTIVLGQHAYCPYDSIYNGYVSDYGRLYYSNDLKSWAIHPYEYHSLRLGVGGFCFAAGFYANFCYQPIAPGYELSDSKTRVWIGSWDSVLDWYTEYFYVYWGYSWYVQNQDSVTAYNYAYDQSLVRATNGATYSYFYNSMGDQSITFPSIYYITINTVGPWGNTLYADIYVDSIYVGTGYVYMQITPGWHFIDATNPVYDEFLGYDVWVSYGTGSFYIDGSTYHTIPYS